MPTSFKISTGKSQGRILGETISGLFPIELYPYWENIDGLRQLDSLVFLELKGQTLSKPMGSGLLKHEYLKDIFTLLWYLSPNFNIVEGKGIDATSDWDEGKSIQLVDSRDAALGSSYANIGNITGANSKSLLIDNIPEHNHPGSTNTTGNHAHTGSANTAGSHAHSYNTGHGRSNNSSTPYRTITEYSNSVTSTLTNAAGSHSHSLTTSTVGNHSHSVTTSNVGSGTPFNVQQKTLYVASFIFTGIII
ncbi:MAG: hypothetical protein WBA17_02605 [Saprospiraceae bacterium]